MTSTKSIFKVLTSIFLSLVFTQSSMAAFAILKIKNLPLDANRRTHIFVTGYAHGLGDAFYASALSYARMVTDRFPEDQALVIVPIEGNESRDLQNRGMTLETYSRQNLDGDRLLTIADQYNRIASLIIFSHSSVHAGAGLNSATSRLSKKTSNPERLADNFEPDAFAAFYGCNSGFFTAPYFSKKWQIAVQGSLTGTDIEQFHNNGNWYFNNPGQYPRGGWASNNNSSASTTLNCYRGGCHRMKPQNSPYKGMWGSYDGGGLGFYKTICNFQDRSRCLRGMKTAMLLSPSVEKDPRSSLEAFQKVVFDFICPAGGVESCSQAILAKVAAGQEVYSTFSGNSINCDLKGCHFDFKCRKDSKGEPIQGTCSISAPTNRTPTAQIREFKLYQEAFAF